MYNRYIPQQDGSYQKKAVRPPQPTQKTVTEEPVMENVPIQRSEPPPVRSSSYGIREFFSRLLPREFDSSDLLIVLLILLMAGDCEQERDNALLTLALYFFM